MQLEILDWSFIIAFFIISLLIGIMVARKSGKSSSEFFLSGRNMPWWLLGVSMVATTFSADTPNLVTDLVRKDGVAGNWVWWAFLITGMLTVFVYAKLWRRSGVLTDLEFYELRYSGKEAAFLRGFRAIYLGVVFNILIMATVCLAAIKIAGTLLGISPMQTLLIASVVTVAYSAIGGLRGIILTDFFQFAIAMIGTIWAAAIIVNLPQVGGLEQLVQHENVAGKLSLLPDFNNKEALISLLIIPLAVQWWAAYYPGSEPGGGGYIAQRMLAAKDEKNAIGATLLYNIAHYALRPWPWILIALASLVVFPDLDSLKAAFPNIPGNVIDDDLAYSAMLTFLPSGLLGIVIASLIAAFMSTISTHLNWGSSYIINDVYKRFVNKEASEKELVTAGRISTVVLMIFAAISALYLKSAKEAFGIIVLMGAGTGLLFILRWFWWRINAYSELAAMIISFIVAITFKFIIPGVFAGHVELILSVLITTVGWLAVTYLTPPVKRETLYSFYKLIKPHSIGWKKVIQTGIEEQKITEEEVTTGQLPMELLAMFAAIFMVYGVLAATGFWLYGNTSYGAALTILSLLWALILFRTWKRLNIRSN
ncbi:MAG: Na+:solute symporter [Chitinophagales bacterium]|nr:Na+:solute symporter [Chitinophagales bacterium]